MALCAGCIIGVVIDCIGNVFVPTAGFFLYSVINMIMAAAKNNDPGCHPCPTCRCSTTCGMDALTGEQQQNVSCICLGTDAGVRGIGKLLGLSSLFVVEALCVAIIILRYKKQMWREKYPVGQWKSYLWYLSWLRVLVCLAVGGGAIAIISTDNDSWCNNCDDDIGKCMEVFYYKIGFGILGGCLLIAGFLAPLLQYRQARNALDGELAEEPAAMPAVGVVVLHEAAPGHTNNNNKSPQYPVDNCNEPQQQQEEEMRPQGTTKDATVRGCGDN